MFDTIAPRYDLMNRLMTFGLDQAWRRGAVGSLALAEGALVLDLACGTGDLSRLARRRGYRVIGADLSAGMLAANGTSTPLVEADGSHLPFADGTFDGLVCGYALRNFTDLSATMAECARVLRAGGQALRARGRRTDVAALAGGVRRLVQPGRSRARWGTLGSGGVPLPPPLGGVPPSGPRAAPDAD